MPVPSSQRAPVSAPAPASGEVRIGPFRLIHQLGRGGFAPVWLAEELYDGRKLRDVAIKLFLPPDSIARGSAEEGRWRDRIIDEARALCRVEHPNVVRFYSLQRDDPSGLIGLAMEYVAGGGLDARLRAAGKLSDHEIIEIGIAVAWALSAVHNAGLVHRDIKPGNIIQGLVGYKLIDFGIVVDHAPEPSSGGPPEPTPLLVGTPGYIAPECIEIGAPPSPGADLFALGATLFKLRTGELPASSSSQVAGPLRRRRARSASTEGSAPSAPGEDPLAELLAQLLDADPGVRPRHADWVARELERVRASRGPSPLLFPNASALEAVAASEPTSPEEASLHDLFAVEGGRAPAPLAPLFAGLRRAFDPDDPAEAGRALGELGLSVVRYAVAVGLALLAALPESSRRGALLEQLQSGARPTPASWCYLLRVLGEALGAADPALGGLFAFAVAQPLAERISALLRGSASNSAALLGAPWVAELLRGAGSLLALPIRVALDAPEDVPTATLEPTQEGGTPTRVEAKRGPSGQPYVVVDTRWICLSPWLPARGDRLLLPEAPAAPGKPWRAVDPASGERQDDAALDEAMRRLVGAASDAHRELHPHPPLVGRDDALEALDRAAEEAKQGALRFLLITGPLGIGRTRLLEAATSRVGFGEGRVIMARCSPERRSLLRPLLRGIEAIPEGAQGALRLVQEAIERALAPASLQGAQASEGALEAVEDALLCASAEEPLLFVVDDIQWGDPYTLELLRLLVERAEAGGAGRLLVVAAARNEPSPGAPLRALLGQVRSKVRAAVKHLSLAPLSGEQAAELLQGVSPLGPELERAVVRGAGGVPFFLMHALLVWREKGAIAWRQGMWHAVDQRVLSEDVPGVADLVEARIGSCFDPASASGRAALRALGAIAIYGGGLGIELVFRVAGDEVTTETALEALVDAGILRVSGERQEYGFGQEMVRQAVLNLVRQRPWFYRLHRALLDAVAEGPSAAADAAFLAAGYDKLGAAEPARRWLGQAMEGAMGAGLFGEAAELGDRLVALTEGAEERAGLTLDVVRALVRGRRFEEAKRRLTLLATRADVLPREGGRALDLRRRVLRLEAARGLCEAEVDDATLLADADALGEPLLRCEARMALAGVLPEARALALAGEAVALAEACGPVVEFAARVLRFELDHLGSCRDFEQEQADLTRALSIATATGSTWRQIHIEGDLAVVEAEIGHLEAAIERLRRLAEQAEARGMRWQLRLLSQNLAALLLRAGHDAEAAAVSQRTAALAAEAGDTALRARALSVRADVLKRLGDLAEALVCIDEAERLQRERGDRMQTLSLLRRAEILEALGRLPVALKDAQQARCVAEEKGEIELAICANLWEKLCLVRHGLGTTEALAQAVAEATAATVTLRSRALGLIAQAQARLRAEPTAG